MVRGYASTLYVINKILTKPEVTPEHIEACRKTPFYYLFKQLFDFKKDKDGRKVGDVLPCQIIKCYDANTNTFKLGEKMLKVTRRDVKVLFAIEEGSEEVPIFSKAELEEKSKWELRIFKDLKIQKEGIVTAIEKVLKETDNTSIKEDFPKLMTLLSFNTLFFCEQGEVQNRKYLKHSEQLDSLKSFNWSKSILRMLVKSLRENLFTPKKVSGCVTAILGWFFEHTTIGKKNKNAINAFPRCLRWTLICKNSNYKKQVIDKLKSDQIIEKIEITDEEFEKLGINKDEKEDEEDEEDEKEMKELKMSRKKCKRKSVIDESATEEETEEEDFRKRKIKNIQREKKKVGKELDRKIKRKSKDLENHEEEEDDEEYMLDSKHNEAESEDEENENEVKELQKNTKQTKKRKKVEENEKKWKRTLIDDSDTEEESEKEERRKRKKKTSQKDKKDFVKKSSKKIKRKSKKQDKEEAEKDVEEYKSYSEEEEDDENDDEEEEEEEATVSMLQMIKDDEEYMLDSKHNEAESEDEENENEVKELQKNTKQTKKRKKVEDNEKKWKRTLIDESDTEEESEREERRKIKKKTSQKDKKDFVKKSSKKIKRKSKKQDEEEAEKDVEEYKSYSEEEEDDENDDDEEEEEEATVSMLQMIKEKERMANDIHKLNLTLTSLKKELEALKKKNQEILFDNKIREDSLTIVEAKLKSMVERVSDLENEKTEAENQIRELTEKNQNYVAELKKLEMSYKTVINKNTEMKEKLKEFEIQEFDKESTDFTKKSENGTQKKKFTEKNDAKQEEKTKKQEKKLEKKEKKDEQEPPVSSMVKRLKARRAAPAAKKKKGDKVVLNSSDSDFQHDEVKEKNVSTKNTKLGNITWKDVTEINPKRTNKKTVKNHKPLEAYFVKEDVKQIANLRILGPFIEVWKKDEIMVTLKDMDNLRKGNMLETQVLEAGFVILQRIHDYMLVSMTPELIANKCNYITNVMYYLDQIDRNENNENYKEEANKMIIQKFNNLVKSSTHYIMFPIYSETNRRNAGHWTLLVCNTEDNRDEVWTHYNPLRASEIGYNEALRVFDYIREAFPSPPTDCETDIPVTLKVSETCPQQQNNLDCGMFVLMYAYDLYNEGKVRESYSIERVNEFRAELYSDITNDNANTIKYDCGPQPDFSHVADIDSPP